MIKLKYRILKPGELLQEGDEYCIKPIDNVWQKTNSVGCFLPDHVPLAYRRRVANITNHNHPQTKLFK